MSRSLFYFLFLFICFGFSNANAGKAKVSQREPATSEEKYTLNQVCFRYSDSGETCGKIPFCRLEVNSSGCQLAPGQPSFVKPNCDLQRNNEQMCRLLEGPGMCRWVAEETQICRSSKDTL